MEEQECSNGQHQVPLGACVSIPICWISTFIEWLEQASEEN